MQNTGQYGRGQVRRSAASRSMDATLLRLSAEGRRIEAELAAPVTEIEEALARMALVSAHGTREPEGYPVVIDGVKGTARVCSLAIGTAEESVLIAFKIPGKPGRVLLVAAGAEGRPLGWLHCREDGRKAFPHRGKYFEAAQTIVAWRAWAAEKGDFDIAA